MPTGSLFGKIMVAGQSFTYCCLRESREVEPFKNQCIISVYIYIYIHTPGMVPIFPKP